jgi:thioredoxin 1
MKLRSKLFIVTSALLTSFTLLALSADCRNVLAQTPSDAVKVTFVEIGSVNCIPCKAMQPIMKAVEEEYKGQVKIVFHDVWTPKGKADAMKYNIRVIPTQVFLDKNGKEYFRHEGYFPKADVVRVIKKQGVK